MGGCLSVSGGRGYGGLSKQSMYLCIQIKVGSHLSHPWVFFHFGHGPEQAWRGRGRRDLQDATEVGGVNGGLLWVEQ